MELSVLCALAHIAWRCNHSVILCNCSSTVTITYMIALRKMVLMVCFHFRHRLGYQIAGV